eukprot:23672_1
MTSTKEYQQIVIGGNEEAIKNHIELQVYDNEENKDNEEENEYNYKNKTLEEYRMGPRYEHVLDEIKDERLDGSPSNWSWQQVQKWLYDNNLWIMWDVLDEGKETDRDGIEG